MKKVILLLCVCGLFAFKGYSQFSFGVSPGLSSNTAQFGYKLGKINPYLGFQYLSGNVKVDQGGGEMKGRVSLIMPEIGVKFFAIEKNKLKAYINLNFAKPFVSGKLEYDGEEAEEFGDLLKDINLIAGNLGFGVEYFFDENFSVGGEYGLQYLHGKYKDSDNDFELNVGLMPTYAKICLNFYFGGSGE